MYLDRDKSKALDVNELKKCVRALRSDVTDRDVEQFMREADSSGDGKIGFEEFYDIMIAQLELGGGHGLTRENLLRRLWYLILTTAVDQEGSLVWDGMCPNFFHAKIDLNWIKGVPLYSDDHVDQIVSRKLRMVRTNIRAFPSSPFRNTQALLRSCTPIPITLRDTKRTLEIK